MSLIKLINFPIIGNHEGSLIALEECKNIPFKIKRVYYIFDTKQNVIRGNHAHKNLKQVAICVSGACQFTLDDGKTREQVTLDSPSKGLYIQEYIWREFTNFTPDCVLMVLANIHYQEKDYIRDYNQFLSIINKNLNL